jgi:multiple sugar transport system substrate-binding protein
VLIRYTLQTIDLCEKKFARQINQSIRVQNDLKNSVQNDVQNDVRKDKEMKKLVGILLLLALFASALAGCTPAATEPAPEPAKPTSPPAAEPTKAPAPEEPVTLAISRWAGPHADDQIELLKKFTEETGIQVNVDAIDYGQLYEKQTLNMSGKTGGYDLVWAQEVWVPKYVSQGYLAPMDPFIADPELMAKIPGFDLANYNQSLIKTNTMDGKLYGLPTFIQTPMLVYNKEMFEQAGIPVPEKWTWEETLKAAKAFQEKGTGIAVPAKQGMAAVDVFAAIMRSNGGDYFGPDGKLALNQPANVEAAQFWKDLADVSMQGSATWHWDEVNKAFQFGQAPIGITISGLLGQLEDPANSSVAGKVGYAPLPFSKNPFGTLALWSWCVTADSKHPKEAFQLAAWLTSAETEKAMTLKNGQISAVTSLFSDPELTAKMPWLPALSQALENSATQPLHENAPQLADKMAEILSAIFTGTMTPQEALDKAQEEMAPLF